MDLVNKVFPSGLLQQYGPCEKRPDDFLDGFVLPCHFRKPLHDIFPDTIHEDMEFLEEPHLYISTIDGVRIPASASVTKFAHEYQEHFDGKNAIKLMKQSTRKKWPRIEYVINPKQVDNKDLYDSTKGCMLISNNEESENEIVSVIRPNSTIIGESGENIYKLLRQCFTNSESTIDNEEYWIFDREMTEYEILEKWRLNGLMKRNMGTSAHRSCELAMEGLPFRWYDPEMKAFYIFLEKYMIPKGAVIMSTEREIRSLSLDIAGSIDAVFLLPDGSIVIVDYKLSDKLYMNMTGFRKMKKPLNNLDDCDGAAYALQTSIYQYLFEKEYGLKVSERILVSLSPEHPFITSVPYLKNEVEFIMNKQRALVNARNTIEGFKCDISNRTLIDPVKCEDGRIVSEKIAQLYELKYEPDEDTRNKLNSEIESIIVDVKIENDGLKNWKKMMPKYGGLEPFS